MTDLFVDQDWPSPGFEEPARHRSVADRALDSASLRGCPTRRASTSRRASRGWIGSPAIARPVSVRPPSITAPSWVNSSCAASRRARRSPAGGPARALTIAASLGVLAAFAVPQYLASVERSKAAGSFNYLSAVQAAQERYHARQGTYADEVTELDIKMTSPKYFTVGTVAAGSTGDLEDSWTLTLTRAGASAGYGEYTVTFTEEGFDADNSAITDHDDINPMQT